MCVNTHYVYNRYIKRNILVDCGKCPSCLQKKAASRANRIRNNASDGQICLFVTLTYKNEFVPYVYLKDVDNQLDNLPVYRDSSIRKIRKNADYTFDFVSDGKKKVIDTFWCHDLWPNCHSSLKPQLNKKPGCIGVCYYKDLQDFFKRLRVNLKRHYNYDGKFTSFSCSEYGGSSYRPHFHSLIFIPKFAETTFRRCITESWPFADCNRTSAFIEVARDCASYVSSYVNSGDCLYSLLSFPFFKQKHSYSKTFGMGVDSFNLPSLLEKIKSGDMRYYSKVIRDGKQTFDSFPVPKYIVNRYFPQFKGFSRLSPSALHDVVLHPEKLSDYRCELDYTNDDLHKIIVRQNHAFDYYHSITGKSRFDYAIDFVSVWRSLKSVILRDSLTKDKTSVFDWLSHYENINDLNCDIVSAPTLTALFDSSLFEENPNKLSFRLEQERKLVPLYYRMCKQRKVVNKIMADSGFEV